MDAELEDKSKKELKVKQNIKEQPLIEDKQSTKDCLIITEEPEDLDTSTDHIQQHDLDEPTTKLAPKQRSDPAAATASNAACWVSNVNKTVKANDLKKVFSSKGNSKVTTAKVMTNGKSYFGYVCLETREMAEDCVKKLNNMRFNGRRVVVSLQRPDLSVVANVKKTSTDATTSVSSNKAVAVVKKKASASSTSEKKVRKSASPKRVNKVSKSSNNNKNNEVEVAQLNRRLRALQSELQDSRKHLVDAQTKLRLKNETCDWLRKQLNRVDEENRAETRRLKLEREQFEKKQRLEQIRYEADKTLLNREIDECKKLREYLESKINDMAETRRPRRQRSRSPQPLYGGRSRASSPAFRSSMSARVDKRSSTRYSSRSRERRNNRTPPPPPRLSTSDGQRRSSHDVSSKSYALSSSSNSKSASGQNARFVPSAAVVRGGGAEASTGGNAGAQSLMDPKLWSTGYPMWRDISESYDGYNQQYGNNLFYPSYEKGLAQQDMGNSKRY